MNTLPTSLLGRKIIHIDMDCFYAAVEMRDFPELKNKPIAVGGPPSRRGVLSTCNYLARDYGIRSAMPSQQALKLCPNLIIQPGRMQVYREESEAINQIFSAYTSLIEPLSLDEAFLDVTDSTCFKNSATWMAEAIRKDIYQKRGLTASAGVAPNKSLAKIASDWHKPNGQKVIRPEDVASFMLNLPVRKLFGVGPKMENRLSSLNINTCADLQGYSKDKLTTIFGKQGSRLYQLARGLDEREVCPSRNRKSISVEHTFSKDIFQESDCLLQLPALIEKLATRLNKQLREERITGLFIKIKFSDFKQTTVDRIAETIVETIDEKTYTPLLKEGLTRHPLPVRLLGLGVRLGDKKKINGHQLSLNF